MSELVVMENLREVFTEYENMVKGCLDAESDAANWYCPPEMKAEIYRKAVSAASELQAHYGQQVAYCGNLLLALDEQLDACDYMRDEAGYAAIAARLPGTRMQLLVAEQCFQICGDCAEKLIACLEVAQSGQEKPAVQSG